MRGKLYGIGVGPGDPELLTLRAVRAIRECAVIAVPVSGNGERTAFLICEEYLAGKELLECRFVMERDPARRREARQAAADQIMAALACGEDVGFLTLGDPAVYSTYMYVHEIVVAKGFEAAIVPGISSYSAAAAALGAALCEEDESLLIIPGGAENLGELLDRPGNKVLMKSGPGLAGVLSALKARGLGEKTKLASRVTMDGEKLYHSIAEYEAAPEKGYFTVTIVKGDSDG